MKSAAGLPEDAVEALRPGDVQLYLRSRGWVDEPYGAPGKGLRFSNPAFPKVDLLLPLKRELADYSARMMELVVSIATIERRLASAVLSDLSITSADVLRLRIQAADAELGSLPLDEAIKLLQGGRDLLAAAANSAVRPRAFHPQTMPSEVTEFLTSCRLGQTERGSFIATIITPVPPEVQQPLAFGDDGFRLAMEPYARQVTTRLMSTLGHVSSRSQASAKLKTLDELVDEGVSADLCDALRVMKPVGELSQLDVSISWARTRSRVPDQVPRSVSFPQESFGWIEEVGRTLRMRPTPQAQRFEGKLIQVKSIQRPLFKEVAGVIVLRTKIDDATARVKVDLNHVDFRRACEALRDGKNVAVTGIIRREVKVREYELTEPRGFEVVGEP